MRLVKLRRLWAKLLVSTPFSLSMPPASFLQITATADAMASQSMAGFGGAAFFPDGTCVWFQFQITLAQANEHWHWVGSDTQKHIAAWELLAQFVLTVCIESRLPRGRGPVACQQGTDNSAADAASAKGLSMTPAVSAVTGTILQIYEALPHFSQDDSRAWSFERHCRLVESIQAAPS